MNKTTPAINTQAAIQARKTNTHNLIEKVLTTVKQMTREQAVITPTTVARRAQVSRTFLYQNNDARKIINDAHAAVATQKANNQSGHAAAIEQSWRERALNAESGLTNSHKEIELQRKTIGELLGRIRDLEADLPEDGVQRVLNENATLRRQVRELDQQIKTSNERLQAARNNNRSLDIRLSELEVQLTEQRRPQTQAEPDKPAKRASLHRIHDATDTR